METTVLVLGKNGYFGSNFFQWHRQWQQENPNYRFVFHPNDGLERNYTGWDLADYPNVVNLFMNAKPDVVLNCVGRVPFQNKRTSLENFMRGNSMVMANIVMAASTLKNRPHIIYPSTAGMYPVGGIQAQYQNAAREIIYAKEGDLRSDPLNAYVGSKLMAEALLEGYEGPWTILRKPTVIGLDEKRGNFLQQLALYLLEQRLPEGERKQVLGPQHLQRCSDYVAATDVCGAMMASVTHPQAARHIINIGSGNPTTGYQALAGMVAAAAALGYTFPIDLDAVCASQRLQEAYPGTVLDIAKARQLLDYQPQVPLDEIFATICRDSFSRPEPLAYLHAMFYPSPSQPKP